MSFISWKEEYELGISEIDEQHKKMLGIINELHDLMGQEEKADQSQIDKIIKEMADYAMYHFKTEEKYFNLFSYEDTETHMTIHSQYAQKVSEWQSRYDAEKDQAIFFEIFNYLQDWWIWHICHTDRDYVSFFKANGLN
jgi:hemerythrin